jgi:damage-control phosphatase, subfamily III
MLQTSLWGNATDLSLLAGGATEESLKKLQSRGAEEAKMILRNDEAQVWDWVQTKKDARLDIVLDNSGFE